ncbi:MAG: PilZ domain-containing protein, partial [Oleiharenicola lentus]
MLFFKRILAVRKPAKAAANRRVASRFAIHDGFPIKAVLNIVGRDELGQPLKARNGEGWDWHGKLLNLSTTGARLQVPPKIMAHRGDFCRLKLDVEGFQLVVPGRIAHVAERRDSFVFGLELDLGAANTQACYRQLIDLVALGSSLKLVKPAHPDGSGYLLEQYAGEPA